MHRVRPIYSNTFTRRRRGIYAVLIVLIAILLTAGAYYFTHRNPRPSRSEYPVMGLRLDQTDGFQDFGQLSGLGVRYVYLKATEGASYFDDDFNANYERGSSSTIAVGAFHYFSFSSSPSAQANYFISKVGDSTGTLPIGIEVSEYTTLPSKKVLDNNLNQFINLIKIHYGRNCVIMGSPKVLAYISAAAPQTQRMQLGGSAHQAKSRQFWEYSSAAAVPGGSDKFHCSVFVGSKAAFQRVLTQ